MPRNLMVSGLGVRSLYLGRFSNVRVNQGECEEENKGQIIRGTIPNIY